MKSLSRFATPLASAAALLALSFSWFSAVPRLAPVVLALAAPFDAAEAETLVCEVRSGRSRDECGAETEGKALIREAELAQASARHARAARTRIQ